MALKDLASDLANFKYGISSPDKESLNEIGIGLFWESIVSIGFKRSSNDLESIFRDNIGLLSGSE